MGGEVGWGGPVGEEDDSMQAGRDYSRFCRGVGRRDSAAGHMPRFGSVTNRLPRSSTNSHGRDIIFIISFVDD